MIVHPRERRRSLGEVPTVWLMPLAVLGALTALIAAPFLGPEHSLLLSVVAWVCVAIVVTHTALLIAYVFGWSVWDLLDRPPKPTTAAGHNASTRGDEERVV